MKLLSVNVSLPKQVLYQGKTITTGIFKEPVQNRVRLRGLTLEGDGQADLDGHGGPYKAVYVYGRSWEDFFVLTRRGNAQKLLLIGRSTGFSCKRSDRDPIEHAE